MSDVRFTAAIAAMNKAREESGVDINGKQYSMVKSRVEVFRQQFGAEFGIDTEIIHNPLQGVVDNIVTMRARIIHVASGNVAGSGHAMAFYGSDAINTESIIEAVETSAIGRALASFGLHGGEYASDREMEAIPAKKAATSQDKMSTAPRTQASRPSVNQYKFYLPLSAHPDELRKVYDMIDNIPDVDSLTAYYNFLTPMFGHMPPEDEEEIKASFRARHNQMKGM